MKKEDIKNEIITLCEDDDKRRFDQVSAVTDALIHGVGNYTLEVGKTYEIVIEEAKPRTIKERLKREPQRADKAVKVKITRIADGIIEGVIDDNKCIVIHYSSSRHIKTIIVSEAAPTSNYVLSEVYDSADRYKNIERGSFKKEQLYGELFERTVHCKPEYMIDERESAKKRKSAEDISTM